MMYPGPYQSDRMEVSTVLYNPSGKILFECNSYEDFVWMQYIPHHAYSEAHTLFHAGEATHWISTHTMSWTTKEKGRRLWNALLEQGWRREGQQ